MTPEQARAARAWLGWTQKDLANYAHVGVGIIIDFEAGKNTPTHNNFMCIRNAFVASGMKIEPGIVAGPIVTPRAPDGGFGE
jgi:predicted transcriptional regulator